ncbi:MAG: hypothetical protein M9887_07255 [Chitinophagales bacterium]|nr:hypothetical protein [Chitinophagales bacterium]
MRGTIRRGDPLKKLGNNHHYGLLLSSRIKKGIKSKVELERIKEYIDWAWEMRLKPLFEVEETYLYNILGYHHELVATAQEQHKRIESLCKSNLVSERNIKLLDQQLDDHIKFEKRILFDEVRKVASEDQLEEAEDYELDFDDNEWSDKFWE